MKGEYMNKFVTPEMAAKAVKSGDWVDFGFGTGFPELMDKAIAARAGELTDVKIRGGLVYAPKIELLEADPEHKAFTWYSWHIGAYERKKQAEGQIRFVPMLLRQVPFLYRQHYRVDVAVVPVSKPDADGYCTFGAANYCFRTIMEAAKTVIFEVNEYYPVIPGPEGSNRAHISEADYVVEGKHSPLPVQSYKAPSETEIAIAKNVLAEIPDGATLGLGVGGVPFTVANMIAESGLRDLGCHTGTISDAYMAMYEAGKLTGANKAFDRGLMTWNLAAGSAEFYEWLQDHAALCHPDCLDYVHDPARIGQLKNYVSINGGVALDLMGQENAETAGTRQLSGTGGQLDFLEGAFRSEGGRGYICMASARKAKDGSLVSNIVPFIPAGCTTSAPRAMIENVATEYGVAHLTGKTVRERAEEMIKVAHPQFRDELRAYAEKNWK